MINGVPARYHDFQHQVHCVVDKLVVREHPQGDLIVDSDMKEWPQPSATMRACVSVRSLEIDVWMPDWSDANR